jgi:TnpA family transposase
VPVDFLTAEQQKRYGRFAGEPTPEQLAKFFHFDEEALAFVRGNLGRALQVGTVRFLGTFLDDLADTPTNVVRYVAQQLNVLDPFGFLETYRQSQMVRVHAREIRTEYGYRDLSELFEGFRLLRWLYARAWGSATRPSVLFDLATARLVEHKVILPGVTTLARLVSRVRERATLRLWQQLDRVPTAEQRDKLLALLVLAEGKRQTELDRLRRPPTKVSSIGFVGALKRLRSVRELGVGHHDISHFHPGRLTALSRFATTARAQAIERLPLDRRIATLLAFAQAIEIRASDDALDILDPLLKAVRTASEKSYAEGRLHTIPDFDSSSLRCAVAARIFVDPAYTDLAAARAALFARFPLEQVLAAADAVEGIAQPEDEDHVCKHIVKHHHGRMRRFLPLLMDTIAFEGTDAAKPVIDAWNGLRALEGRKVLQESDVALAVVPAKWMPFVVESPGVVNREAYTMCVLERLGHGLRRREIFAPRSKKWGDPRSYLLPDSAWPTERPKVCRSLNLPTTPGPFIDLLREEVDASYHLAADRFEENAALRIEEEGDLEKFVLTPLEAVDEPESLKILRSKVNALMPHIDLPDLLLEVNAWTPYADEFTHISEGRPRVENISTSICAVLLAEACNVGLEPVARQGSSALTKGRLSWVTQNYVRADTLRRANTRLVNYQATIPLAKQWGGGAVATVDGIRFVVPVRSINAGPNPKYFDVRRGVTYFNYGSDQFTNFHSIVIPGTMRDSLFILSGLLEQETDLRPKELISDNAGYSDLVFGLFRVLGYQFSPRIADLGDARLWRFDRDANYGRLDGIARNYINPGLIAPKWDDVLRVAGSLSCGRVQAHELVRVLQADGRPTALARAIAEIGRCPKTVHLLRFADDETYRRRMKVHLNHHEGRHGLSREVFHGQLGELRQRYREGQEDQLGALGLVVNTIVLWNTRYIDAALNHLREKGEEVLPQDVERLSPLGYDHINLVGRYHFGLPDAAVQRGALRPLRDPNDLDL